MFRCCALLVATLAAFAANTTAEKDTALVPGIGKIIDPNGDCKFTVEDGKLTITIPGSDHGLSIEQNRMGSPRVLQDVEGDFIAQVKVCGAFPQGATSLVEGRRAFHGAGLLLWQDEGTYLRLERAELVLDGMNLSYGNFELRKDKEFVQPGDAGTMPLENKDVFLRLERRGAEVHGAVSADGTEWKAFPPIAVELAKGLRIGVVAGHNTSTGYAPRFEGFKLFKAVAPK
jgi:regulation of enolase protein 1 (concanavalin A-like superfamily)